MAERTQCEAEALYRTAASKITGIAIVSSGLATAASLSTTVPPQGKLGLWGLSVVWTSFAVHGHYWANQYAKGCRQEYYEQGRRDAAAAANGTAGSGTGDHHGVEHGQHRSCQSVYITTGAPATTNSRGDIVLTAGYFSTFCTPIVLDLDGDGIEYIPISSGIYTNEEWDGRWEQRAWLSPDDGMLFYDEDSNGIGTHHETILTDFVEGAATDLEALRAFDSNKDGVIDASDALYASLKVGRDFNCNGLFEANEVFSLAQAGWRGSNFTTACRRSTSRSTPRKRRRGSSNSTPDDSSGRTGRPAPSPMSASRKSRWWRSPMPVRRPASSPMAE